MFNIFKKVYAIFQTVRNLIQKYKVSFDLATLSPASRISNCVENPASRAFVADAMGIG